MRKHQKQNCLALANTLYVAHDEIKKLIITNNECGVLELLIQCQQGAIALGDLIDALEGEGNIVISYLERYCEKVYEVYEELKEQWEKNGYFSDGSVIEKVLQQELFCVKESIKKDIPVRLEVVFLSYKVSMWDAMESVWKAATNDVNCDAYVIPIPYYDKNADGSSRMLYYEGDKYPTYVPVVKFEEYNFEERHPDAIFIHSPYDGWNRVTSVLPQFYSEKLKCYTEKLVYIPYYVTGGMISEVHRILPAYFNVDHIILQHERQKAFFIPEISKKISVFGSPKFDKVINLELTEDMVPDEWKTKLRDTVLFLNTGIDGILKNNEKSLLKIQFIIDQVSKEDVTLLWRPHPLLESTIASMRPELWQLYLETIGKFEKMKNGILDRSENVELAIKISDAYLGEPTSSISHMFGVLGKPIFFINQNILVEDNSADNVSISCCVPDSVERDMFWASAANRNGLLKISTEGRVEEYFVIPNEGNRINLYSDILFVDGKIYLIPRNAKEIAVFDSDKRQFNKLSIKNSKQKDKFSKGYFYEGKIYMIPQLYPEMVILEGDNQKIHYEKDDKINAEIEIINSNTVESESEVFKQKKVALTEEQQLVAMEQCFARQGANLPWGIYETKHYSINRIITYVRKKMHDYDKQKKAFESAAVNLDGTAGEKIYSFIAGMLCEE